ncbi:MAG: DUF5686 family protein [Ginsengibacter sp.]
MDVLRQFICFFLLAMSLNLQAQERTIHGKVTDAKTKLPLASCSIYTLNSGNGVISDENGKYTITIDERTDSIAISMIGYSSLSRHVSKAPDQEIDFDAQSISSTMSAVVVEIKTKYNRAQRLVKKVIKNKDQNDVFSNKSYQSEVYDKIEVEFKNIPKQLENNRLLKPLAFALRNMDTTQDHQKALPLYLSESNANFYYSRNPEKERYDYTALKSSGIGNKTVLAYIDGLYKKLNIYDNNIKLVDVNFISPVAENALSFYNYHILDTLVFENRRCIQVEFDPIQFGSNTFKGYMWIVDTSFAIKSLVMHMDKNANINFVNKFEISETFKGGKDVRFLPDKNILYIDLSIPELKKSGVIVKKTTIYKNAILNNPMIDSAFTKKPTDITQVSRDTADWANKRFEPLSKSENSVYLLMDTLNKMPIAITYGKIISAITTGYYTTGPVDIGNLYSIYTNNHVEGNRFTFGLETNSRFNGNLQLSGYAGLSTRDKQFRYMFSSEFVLSRKQWSTLTLTYRSDISGTYGHQNELDQNSIFASFLRRVNYSVIRLLNIKDADISYEKFWNNGFGISGDVKHRILTPFFNVYYTYNGFQPYILTKPGVNNDYIVNEATVSLRYSHRERFISQHYTRGSLGSNYPIVVLSYTKGIKINTGMLKSDFSYSKWNLNIQHDFTDGRIGQLSYTIDAGLTNGVLPVVLLDVQKGNDTYYYNQYAFNNMNRYEFATDKYASLSVQQSFGSFPFKYFPLLKRLKWRSLATFKGVIGDMSEANKVANGYYDSSINYHFTIPNKQPYIEVGAGIDNIFHLIRIDAVWRLNYLNNPGISRFGIKGSIELKF